MAHEARQYTTLATDAVEDGVYAAKRAIRTAKRMTDSSVDFRDEMAYRIKREPFKFVAIALSVGIQFGLIIGWLRRRSARRVE